MYLIVKNPVPVPVLVSVKRILTSELPTSAQFATLAALAPAVIEIIPNVPPAIPPAAVNAVAFPTKPSPVVLAPPDQIAVTDSSAPTIYDFAGSTMLVVPSA